MVKISSSKYLGFLLLGNLIFLLLGAFPSSLAFFPPYIHQHIIATRQAFFVSPSRPKATAATTICFLATTTTTTKTRRRKRIRNRKWDEMIPRLQEFNEKFGHTNITSAYDPDLYSWVKKVRNNYRHQIHNTTSTTRKPRLSEEKILILKELDFNWGIDRGTQWKRLIQDLQKYKDEHGHTHVKFDENDELYTWTKRLRYRYRHQALDASTTSPSCREDLNATTTNQSHLRPQLSPSKIKELNDLGFDWETKQGARWKQRILELKAYKDKHGHTNVTVEENETLHKWARQLRCTYRYQALNMSTMSNPQRPRLSSTKMNELNKIGFDWESQKEARWKRLIDNLNTYKEQNGHTNVKHEEDGELYKWTKHLRDSYRHQALNISTTSRLHRLSPTKLKELNDVGFDWEVKGGTRWNRLLQDLTAYKKKHGHTHVKFEENAELYKWTKNLRYMYSHQALDLPPSGLRRKRLSTWKMKELDDLGFAWDAKIKYSNWGWDDMMQRLVAYKAKHGHTAVEKAEDKELHRWTTHLANAYGPQLSNSTTTQWHRRLSRKRFQELRDIDFTWKSRSSLWKRRYEELREFRREHGHCNPPARENPHLYTFVQNQRQAFRRHRAGKSTFLTEERIQALARIDFDWAKPHNQTWAERKSDLDYYFGKYGNSNVPQKFADNLKLGRWCMNQRTDHRKENAGTPTGLTANRIQLLEEVDFQWSPKAAGWRVMAARLREYQASHGHLDIKMSDSENQDLRLWLNEQRHFYKREDKRIKRLSSERIEILQAIPEFSWRKKRKGPSKGDWSDLFFAIRDMGIQPGGKAKEHIFDGKPRFDEKVKTEWTEQELMALWNEENDEDDENADGDFDEDEGEFFEDEESRLFLRA